ncbi:MAG: thermonuclease family protein [Candidatus Zambryskibacteria bacterium]|nr:thermonuclease family protein [Candidatus Zambryskibacteria bacterium]
MNKKKITLMVTLIFSVFLLISEYRGDPSVFPLDKVKPSTTVVSQKEGFYLVTRVVDGDTIEVTKNGVKEKVRLLGINTPETVDPRKMVECFGKEASAHAKELLAGKQVKIVSDDSQTKYDKYGRLLAYVYTEEGLFVNKHMIEEGYAYEYTYNVPYIFQKEFKEAQKKAETEGRGLWGEGVCE